MKKRLLHLFVTALLCGLFLAVTSSAALVTDSTGKFQYATDYGYVSLCAYVGSDARLTMPVTLDGMEVEKWYSLGENATVTALTIPKDFDAILAEGGNPLADWTALKTITAEEGGHISLRTV